MNKFNFGVIKSGLLRDQLAGRDSLSIYRLELIVDPSEVRLKTEDECLYTWQIDDPSLEPLFQKHMSKHSVGAYMQLHREVGKKFRAVPTKAATQAEAKIKDQNSIIQEAQMTIHLHQQDILNWMAVAEWYQTKCFQCSSVLGQMMAFLQDTTSETK
ncbi:unnamed protein product [Penicillium egyptiacum]|uniref:Uncharacterized protein n=1 Tax=Penicillium egyptiacum TaxID=1303716 RepID=A0A9W4KEM9_9EURO|nr:unnamed protein product [Penicillium egyptiacum]